MTKRPVSPQLEKLFASVRLWLEKSGLKAQLDPHLAKFKAMEPSKKTQLITGLMFAVIAANLLVVMAPLVKTMIDTNQKIQKISTDIDLARKDISARDQMKSKLQESESSVGQIERLTFKNDQVHQFLDVLSDMAKESRIKIESLAPVSVKGSADYPRPLPRQYSLVGFELAGKAGYHELGNFIARVESGEPFVKVELIEIFHDQVENRRVHDVKVRFLVIRRN